MAPLYRINNKGERIRIMLAKIIPGPKTSGAKNLEIKGSARKETRDEMIGPSESITTLLVKMFPLPPPLFSGFWSSTFIFLAFSLFMWFYTCHLFDSRYYLPDLSSKERSACQCPFLYTRIQYQLILR